MRTGDVSDQFFNPGTVGSKYPNPFYGIPEQYLPTDMDGMLWWAEKFLFKFEFYRPALERIASYFLTQIMIESDSDETKDEYKKIFEEIHWKDIMTKAGLDYLAYGNSFISINQGIERFLACPRCHKRSAIERLQNYQFNKGKYYYQCPSPDCMYKGEHKVIDIPTKDLNKINVNHWSAREVVVNFEETSGRAWYYWDIPQHYKTKVMQKDNKSFSKVVATSIFDAINGNRMMEFNKSNFIHLAVPTPTSLQQQGKGVPPCIYMFDSFFMLKVLERFNEVICHEDIAPFRVISMADGASNITNPMIGIQDGGSWKAAVNKMIEDHRRDPGNYHTFPFRFSFEHLSGDAKQLAPVELMELIHKNILNGLNIPQEFYAMNLQSQALGPALRLFENSWHHLVSSYNRLVQHIADVIGKIKGLDKIKAQLEPVTFADDVERKSVLGQLVGSNAIAKSTLLETFKINYKDQVRKRMEEEETVAELQEEQQRKKMLEQSASNSIFGPPGAQQQQTVASGGPQDVLNQAKEIAQQLQPMDAASRRAKLQEIKQQGNETLWSSVKAQLEQMDRGVQSQALQQSKQQ